MKVDCITFLKYSSLSWPLFWELWQKHIDVFVTNIFLPHWKFFQKKNCKRDPFSYHLSRRNETKSVDMHFFLLPCGNEALWCFHESSLSICVERENQNSTRKTLEKICVSNFFLSWSFEYFRLFVSNFRICLNSKY